MIYINQLKLHPGFKEQELLSKICKILKVSEKEILSYEIAKQSIDARKKPELFYVMGVAVSCKNEAQIVKKARNKDVSLTEPKSYVFPQSGTEHMTGRPVIIGSGPAGLYCAYFLAKNGYAPLVLERGEDVDARFTTVEKFWETSVLNKESNVQFGEGGAGTFSDGKLNTLNKDPFLRNKEVLKTFVKMGAKECILYEQKPHLGTDVLRVIVKNLRHAIIEHGGEVRFNSKVTKILTTSEPLEGEECTRKVCGIVINDVETVETNLVVLAIGHSARDTFQMLYEQDVPMEAKDFAIGYRVMHPQEMINESQYGIKKPESVGLSAAAYKLTAATQSGRGVYSFCMCPGGYVVNASSEEERLVINGMSYSGRDSETANSAIIVAVRTSDFLEEGALAGVHFQQKIEESAYKIGQGKIPLQLYDDFKNDKISSGFGTVIPRIKGDHTFADVRSILPASFNDSFIEAMESYDRKIKGFARPDVIVCGVETRTSAPVRILRDTVTLESKVKGLYPCGEGAGYAGGITSAAADGIKVAEVIAAKYKKQDKTEEEKHR